MSPHFDLDCPIVCVSFPSFGHTCFFVQMVWKVMLVIFSLMIFVISSFQFVIVNLATWTLWSKQGWGSSRELVWLSNSSPESTWHGSSSLCSLPFCQGKQSNLFKLRRTRTLSYQLEIKRGWESVFFCLCVCIRFICLLDREKVDNIPLNNFEKNFCLWNETLFYDH